MIIYIDTNYLIRLSDYHMLNWQSLIQLTDSNVRCTIHGKEVTLKITKCDELQDGQRWVSFVFLNNTEYSPTFYGTKLGNCNSLYEPKSDRSIRGWKSLEIFESIQPI